jgi:Predicted molecular chaperone distantly related to HSP70-fold metalloproteases
MTVLKILEKNEIKIESLDFIASHGQTIYHIPTRATFQIGEISVIAEVTKTLTIGDFRVRDVAAGGHGAPLVPYSEYLLYRSENKNIVLQNIGGIGNATLLLKNCKLEDVIAFDTGPGNMIIDYVVEKLTYGEKKYDNLGEMAARGKIDYNIVEELLKDPYFEQAPPKTTGREKYGKEFADNLIDLMKSKN